MTESKPLSWVSNDGKSLARELLPYFPEPLRNWLGNIAGSQWDKLEEIRLRTGKPVFLQIGSTSKWLTKSGKLAAVNTGVPYLLESQMLQKIIALITQSSFYALETELAQGYLTLKGGHRVGFTGEALLDHGKLKGMKHLSSLNFRLAREIKGAADKLTPLLIDHKYNRIYHTLIVSPPGAGKTTLLRDLIRQLSDGVPGLWPGAKIGLVDERSEIAGCFQGIPQNDVGLQTDVLDGCPKAEGMMLLLRSMSPRIIAVDELGRKEDVASLWEMLNAGVTVLATIHGHEIEELEQRPVMGELMKSRVFERIVLLSRRLGPGTIEKVVDTTGPNAGC
ncbi:MAG: stage III sporulation protein AA [Clostridia bacterium]|jgi:stage III sporulation protein AA|nr:stage III sporulation protein AA [Clostridia bacterium]